MSVVGTFSFKHPMRLDMLKPISISFLIYDFSYLHCKQLASKNQTNKYHKENTNIMEERLR